MAKRGRKSKTEKVQAENRMARIRLSCNTAQPILVKSCATGEIMGYTKSEWVDISAQDFLGLTDEEVKHALSPVVIRPMQGSHIRVTNGKHTGTLGVVTKVNSKSLLFRSDNSKLIHKVKISQCEVVE